MIDHSLLHPTLTDKDLRDGCELALKYDTASVCIKPYAVPLACAVLKGSDVRVGTVIGFPHGSSSSTIKIAEAEQAVSNGAVEVDMVVNIGKVRGEARQEVKDEIKKINEVVVDKGAILKVIFENDFLTNDQIIRLCEICGIIGVGFCKNVHGLWFCKAGKWYVCLQRGDQRTSKTYA